MASKLALLQKLLIDREEVILLHRGKAHCSCGVGIDDFSDIENHLVHAHDKLSSHSSRKCLQVVLKDTINRLSDKEDKNLSEQQLDIEVPLKTFAVCLDEDLIADGGRLREAFCHICSASCYSFKTLKDHYMRQHPQTWACPATCLNVDRILFTKPSKEQSLKIPTGWGYQYYCPLPGCKYHVGQHQSGVLRGNGRKDPVFKSFPSYSLLKQHYSKMHAHRSQICERCGSGFATDVYLRRHKKLTCGKAWTCPSCKAVFSAKENLQTHCRRKGHQLSWDSCKKSPSPPPPTKSEAPKGGVAFFKHEKANSVVGSKYVRIAPMPSLTMTAALALADLASFSTESKNQQQSIIASHREEEEDKLLWSAAGTQTEGQQQQPGPRGETPPMAVPEITEESILKAAAAIPKLGEIAAQFSTDSVSLATQTDDLEMLLKPSTSTGGYGTTTTSTSIGQNEDAFTIEAQTQFDLDDIFGSKYTQTALFNTSLDPNSGVNSTETQTMLMSYDLVNMETQTMSMLDF